MNDEFSNVILGTGNYDNIKTGNTVSITGDGGNAWGYFGPSYKKLAPKLITYKTYADKKAKLENLKLDIEEYSKLKQQIEDEYIISYYETRLKELDLYELLEYFKRKYGNEIIILCHEPIKEFCHRRLLADYIELETGIYIPEVIINDNGQIIKKNPIRYKNRLIKTIKNEK